MRLFGSGTRANPRLWITRGPRKFERPVPKTERSWGKTRPRVKNILLRKERWQTAASSSRTLYPKGLRRVQRPGATFNIQRDSNSRVTKNHYIDWRSPPDKDDTVKFYSSFRKRVSEQNTAEYLIRSRNFISRRRMNFSDNVCEAIEVRDTVRNLSINVHSLSNGNGWLRTAVGALRIAARTTEKLELDKPVLIVTGDRYLIASSSH